ncbi:MAG: hypothetical protein ACJ79H_22235 [Myxococcales bacterium]
MAPRRRSAVDRTGGKGSTPARPRGKPGKSRSKPAPPPESSSSAQSDPPGSALPDWFGRILAVAQRRAAARVEAARARFPEATRRELGERLVRTSALHAGLLGAATGTLALITLPLGLPAGIAMTLLLEAELLFALIALYGLSARGPSGRLRLYALWAGAGCADAAKGAGLRLGADAVGRAIAGSLPARIIARLNPILLRAILRRLGLGWLPRALKMWPLLGAPVGFAVDRAALRALGTAALDALEAH